MNDLSSDTIGVFRRELRNSRSIVANMDHKLRQLLDGGPRVSRPGITARFATCNVVSRITRQPLDAVARQYFRDDRDLARLIERTISSPATTTGANWAVDLVVTVVADVAENLLPQTVLAQLRALGAQYNFIDGGIARVPMHTPPPSGAFVPEGGGIPVAALLLASFSLFPKKAAAITAFTRELAQGSPVNIETTLRTLLADDLGMMVDQILLGTAAATTAQPAGLFAGVTPIVPSTGGGTGAAMGDVKLLMAAISPSIRPILLMNATQAASLSIFAPMLAVPMIVAPYMASASIAAVDVSAFASAIGVPEFDVTDDPLIHEESSPLPLVGGVTQPPVIGSVAAPQRSLWQTAAIGIRTLLDINWTMRRTGAVAIVNSKTW